MIGEHFRWGSRSWAVAVVSPSSGGAFPAERWTPVPTNRTGAARRLPPGPAS